MYHFTYDARGRAEEVYPIAFGHGALAARTASVDVEVIARIVEPNAWALIDHWKGKQHRPDLFDRIADKAKPSLTKDTAIVRLINGAGEVAK